jgi:hypothetical protein
LPVSQRKGSVGSLIACECIVSGGRSSEAEQAFPLPNFRVRQEDIQVSARGFPSDMRTHIISGVCPWMYLWNPSGLGYLRVCAANLLRKGKLTDSVGSIFTAGSLGERIITEAADGGMEAKLDYPIMFNLTNVAVWVVLF